MTATTQAPPNPYVGPRSFQTGEKLYGREREVNDLLGLLIAERIVLLYSPSGAGKTSLVQAALIPRLQEQDFTVLPVMRVSIEPPAGSAEFSVLSAEFAEAPHTSHPTPQTIYPVEGSEFSALGSGVAKTTQNSKPWPEPGRRLKTQNSHPNHYILSLLLSLEEGLPPEQQMPLAELAGMSLNDYLDRRLSDAAAEGIVLIFDQFEEILTVDPTNLEAKHAFFAQVATALRNRRRWALFSMREDYVAALDPYLRPMPTRLKNTYRLDLLGAHAARAAIQEPARGAGAEFETAAARQLIEDLSRVQVQRADGEVEERPGPWVEPVQLQVVCYRLWSRLPEGARHIGMGEVETLGNVDTALSDYYAEHVAEVAAETGAGERPIREWFDRALITPERRRGQVLQTHEQSQGLANSAIWPLIDAYLVRAEKRRGATWFELAHDRLIEPLRSNNAAWRETHLSLMQRQADLWNSQGRPDGLLLRDAKLVEAEAWAAQQATLTDVERAFLARCQEVREIVRRARRNRRIISILAVVASAIGVIALVLAVLALQARDQAEVARTEAIARQLAAQSLENRHEIPQRALLLAVEAYAPQSSTHIPSAKSALYAALASVGGTPLLGHQAPIQALAFSPDGRLLATAGDDRTVRLWDAANPGAPPSVLSGHLAPITALAFSPDGRHLATGALDNTARLWDVASPGAPPAILRHDNRVAALAFSPDGRHLATASTDGVARLWDVASPGAPPARLPAGEDPMLALAFSPDGRRLATGGDDAIVRLWDVGNPTAAPVELEAPAGTGPDAQDAEKTIRVLAFSPDGRYLATGAADGIARVWEPGRPDAPALLLEGHASTVVSLAFSPDSRYLATGSTDKTARLWDLAATPPAAAVLSDHTDQISAVAFSPDGRYLATAGYDGAARLWSVEKPNTAAIVLRGHESAINALAFSPDGRHLATGAADGQARLWDIARLSALPALYGHSSQVDALAFSPDGRRLATGSADKTVRVWDLSQPAAQLVLSGFEDTVRVVAFSPDGRRLAAGGGGDDPSVRVWDLDQPAAAPLMLDGHQDKIAGLAFNPDGRTLTSADLSGKVNQWDLSASPPTPTVVRPAGDPAAVAALSADARYLATDTIDGSIQVWDLSRPADAPIVFRGHERGIGALAFGPGARLASGGYDRTVRVWDLANPTNPPTILRGHTELVKAVAFSSNGQLLLSASNDLTARLWDLGNLTAEPVTLQGHTEVILAAAFSADDQTIATGSLDNTARLWRRPEDELIALACATAGRNLSWDEWEQARATREYDKTCKDLPVSPSLIDSAASVLSFGDIKTARALDQRVNDLGDANEIPALAWANLCRAGGLSGFIADVRAACDRAVALAPDDGRTHDSRGLARARDKDFNGAIEDFQAYIVWAQRNGQDPRYVARRETWVRELQAGRDPFTPEMLQELRGEYGR